MATKATRGPDISRIEKALPEARPGQYPLEEWNPPPCGDSPIRIDREGRWLYQESPVQRERLVRLFASLLRREADGSYWLVTPVEKWRVKVDDAPFLLVDMSSQGEGEEQVLTFLTNMGEEVTAGPDHPLRCIDGREGFRPYLLLRHGCEALATRSVAWELAGRIGQHEGRAGLWSSGVFFACEEE